MNRLTDISCRLRVVLFAAWMWVSPALGQDAEPPSSAEESEQAGTEAAPVPVQPPKAETPAPGPRDLFVAAAAAVAKAQSISYRSTSTGVGGIIASVTPTVQAEVQQVRAPGGGIGGWRVRAKGVSTPAKGGSPLEFDVAWRSITIEWIDHVTRRVYEKTTAEAKRVRIVSATNAARLDDFTSGRPFGKELDSAQFTRETPREVGEVPCDVVVVATGPRGNIRARWYFSTADHLPRRVERIIAGKGEESRVVLELADVRVETGAGNPDLVRVQVPEGYVEERIEIPDVPNPAAASVPVANGKPVPIQPPTPQGPRMAPDFDLVSASGERVSSASLRGGLVALEFGGTWSLPLRESRPMFDAFVKGWQGRGLRGYSLAVRERTPDTATEAHRAGGFAFGLLMDADAAARDFGVRVFPAYALIGPGGELLVEPTLFKGQATFDELALAAEDAAAKAGPEPKTEAPGK